MPTTKPLPVRRVHFEYPDDMNPLWIPALPEFACAANSVSLLMPYAEPLFLKAVRWYLPELPGMEARIASYVRQEVGHYAQHKKLNDLIAARYPKVRTLQRWMEKCADWIWTKRSRRFSLGFAAGGECISYAVARWADKHIGDLFDGADPVPTTLFLWHLAEEVEHKAAAWEVFEAVDGSRWRYAWATFSGFALLGFFTWLGTLMMLFHDGRAFYPVTWYRMLRWSLSLAFDLFPTLLASALPGHHPNDFSDPILLTSWLRLYDPVTKTMPLWDTGTI